MPRRDETPRERLRKIPLWQWGLLCLLGAGFSGLLTTTMMGPPKGRAEAAGRGAASLLFVVAGLVLIVLHFVWPKKGKAKAGQRRKVKPPRP